MVRSGSVNKRSRASSPTITLPLAPTLTTDGHNEEPYGPGIVFGAPVCASTYATRLYVVPRSIPTALPMILLRRIETLPKTLGPTMPRQFPSALHPLDSEYSCACSRLLSCSRAEPIAWLHRCPIRA